MCPVMDLSELTLDMMWNARRQLIVFYHHDTSCRPNSNLWPAHSIAAPWHNTRACADLVSAVERGLSGRPTASNTFHVTQAVLTPDAAFIMSHFGKKLRGSLTGEALAPFFNWLRRQNCEPSAGINIVTVDFVETTQLVEILMNRNQSVASMVCNLHSL